MESFDGHSLSHVLYALAELRVAPSDAWLDAAMAQLQAQAPFSFGPSSFGVFAYATALLRIVPPPAARAAFLEASWRQLHAFSPLNLSNTLLGVASWGGPALPPAWLRAFCAAAAPQLPSFSAQQLCLVLWNLAAVCGSALPPASFLDAAEAALAPQLAETSPQGVARALSACARLGYRPSAPFLRAAMARFRAQLAAASPADIARAAEALATLRVRPHPAYAAALLDAFTELSDEASVATTAAMCHACVLWQLPPTRQWALNALNLLRFKGAAADADSVHKLVAALRAWGVGEDALSRLVRHEKG